MNTGSKSRDGPCKCDRGRNCEIFRKVQTLREFSLWADSTACDADRVDDFYSLQQLAPF